jgi:hypothetical protein
MPKTDYSEYEKRRAENHEIEWRLTATLVLIRSRFCHFRECRRVHYCIGPMVRSAHQDGQVVAQKEIGLSGDACACLPFCVAHASPPEYEMICHSLKQVRELRREENNDGRLLMYFRKGGQVPRDRKRPRRGSNDRKPITTPSNHE